MTVKNFHNSTEQMLIYVAGVISEYDLTRDGERDQLYKHITDLVSALETDTSEIIPYELAVEYFNGLDHANTLLGNNSTSFDSNGRLKAGISNQIHVEQLESLVMDTMMDLSAAYRTFEQNAVGSIDTAINQIRADMAISSLTGRNKTQLIKQVKEAFREQGQTAFITSDGKMLPLDFYAATVVETKLSQANVSGHLQRYDEANVDLVQVMARPGTCEHCAAHDGMVYSRGGSHPKYPEYPEGLIPLHPHCKCTLIPIVEDFLTDSERKAIDERVAKGVDFDPRTDAERALYARDQRINRRNNAEKKLFMKMQAELGADMPMSLPAFRRMKRADTSKYQELYSNYLSATHTGKAASKAAVETIAKVDIFDDGKVYKQINPDDEYERLFNSMKHLDEDDEHWIRVGEGDTMDGYEEWGYIGGYNGIKINKHYYGALEEYEGLTKSDEKTIKYLDKVIDQNTIDDDIIVTRYISGDALEDIIKQNVVLEDLDMNQASENIFEGGEITFENKGYTSTSLMPGNEYLMSMIDMKVEIPKGSKGYVTDNFEESELILPRNTKLGIREMTVKDDGSIDIIARLMEGESDE